MASLTRSLCRAAESLFCSLWRVLEQVGEHVLAQGDSLQTFLVDSLVAVQR